LQDIDELIPQIEDQIETFADKISQLETTFYNKLTEISNIKIDKNEFYELLPK
jgi:hypothetical protein